MAEEFLDDMKFDAELEGFDIKFAALHKSLCGHPPLKSIEFTGFFNGTTNTVNLQPCKAQKSKWRDLFTFDNDFKENNSVLSTK